MFYDILDNKCTLYKKLEEVFLLIEISNLTKAYGSKLALDHIGLSVQRGEIVGLLGPNGAGKSTTMNILTGYISYTSGSVKIDGTDILEQPQQVKRKIGYLPEQPPLYMDMLVKEYLNFAYDLKKVKSPDKKKHIREIAETVRISDVMDRRIGNLSKGYKQRIGLAQALIGNPEILILDEPTVGLDPKQILEIRNVIKDLGEDHTVILSSHILSEISAVCERVIIIDRGKIVAEDTTENLSKNFSTKTKIMLRISGEKDQIEEVLGQIVGVKKVTFLSAAEEGNFDFEVETNVRIDADFNKQLFFTFAEKGMPILMQKELEASLEDIFLQLTAPEQTQQEEEEA